jgi:hypothetical protein
MMKRLIIIVSCFLLLGVALTETAPPSKATNEYKIKTALIYNFLKFTEWPDESKTKKLTLGLLSEDEKVYKHLKTLEGKLVKSRPITVMRLKEKDLLTPDSRSSKRIDVLYVPKSKKKIDFKKLLAKQRGKPVLTIGEKTGFLEAGGIINFMKEDNRIHFEINLDAARTAKLQLKTSLLKLAKRVIKKE